MPHDVFISFSSKDREAAEKIVHGLETRGIACWMSSRDVPAGADFAESIIDAVEAAHAMVLVFSTNANNSVEMKKELVLAGDCRMPVLPVRIENVLPSGAYRYQMTVRQYLDLFEDWDTNIGRLAQQIGTIISAGSAVSDPVAEPLPPPSVPDPSTTSPLQPPAPADRSVPIPEARPEKTGRIDVVRPTIAAALILVVAAGGYYGWQRMDHEEAQTETVKAAAPPPAVASAPGSHAETAPPAASSVATPSTMAVAEPPPTPPPAAASPPQESSLPAAPPPTTASPAPATPSSPPPSPAPSDGKDIELAFWQSIVTSTSAADFQDFLKRYPKGSFASLAKRKIAALQPPPVAAAPKRVATAGPAVKPPPSPSSTSEKPTECDRLAADPYDQKRVAPGISNKDMDAAAAIAACQSAPPSPRILYQLGRALVGRAYSLEAVESYRKAASQEAVESYRKAADQGYAAAQRALGKVYLTGGVITAVIVTLPDTIQAVSLFRKAAEQGDIPAQHALGFMYYYGKGVEKDFTESAVWYRKAAEQGYAPSQFSLAQMYFEGNGVPQDKVQGVSWLRKSAEQGHPGAREALTRLDAN